MLLLFWEVYLSGVMENVGLNYIGFIMIIKIVCFLLGKIL